MIITLKRQRLVLTITGINQPMLELMQFSLNFRSEGTPPFSVYIWWQTAMSTKLNNYPKKSDNVGTVQKIVSAGNNV